MKHISEYLVKHKNDLSWGNQKISTMTGISITNISKHLTGARTISDSDLRQYSKCFNFNFEEIKNNYSLVKIEVCKDGTLAEIIKMGTGILVGAGASVLAYKGVEKLIDNNCKHLSK